MRAQDKRHETILRKRGPIILRDGVAFIPLYRGGHAIIDEDNLPLVQDLAWYESHGYAYSNGRYFMHRLIMNPPKGLQVDHVNGDRLDNRRCNLRLATHNQNSYNTRRPRKGSPYRGVHKASKNRWAAQIEKDGKARYLGMYLTPEEAAQAYDKAAIELFGEYASLNNL